MSHGTEEVMFELGAAGLTMAEARGLMSEAQDAASKIHAMGAEGRVHIPGTTRDLIYNSGIDGMDFKWSTGPQL